MCTTLSTTHTGSTFRLAPELGSVVFGCTAHFHRAKVVNIFHFPWQFCTPLFRQKENCTRPDLGAPPLRHPCRRQLEKSRQRQVNEVSVLSKTEKLLQTELLIFSRPINTHTRAGERLIFFLSKRDAELGFASVRVCVIRKKSSSHLECPR